MSLTNVFFYAGPNCWGRVNRNLKQKKLIAFSILCVNHIIGLEKRMGGNAMTGQTICSI